MLWNSENFKTLINTQGNGCSTRVFVPNLTLSVRFGLDQVLKLSSPAIYNQRKEKIGFFRQENDFFRVSGSSCDGLDTE